jgi:ubiquinone/menaquinone biosynthesis C-methylase UbiE
MRQIDFGQVATSYARSGEDIPASLMDSLFIRSIFFDGKTVADIGSGSGGLTRKMAMRKANVVGVEPSKELLVQANALNRLKNYTIPYRQGTAEDTGLEASKYDIVTVMRAWHEFDRPKALKEIKRILKEKGTLIVIDTRFLPGSDVVEMTFNVLAKYLDGGLKSSGSKVEFKQRINGFPVEWFDEWEKNGFDLRDFYKLKYPVIFTKQEWIERVESISWLAGLEKDERKTALQALADSLPDGETFVIPHECTVCIQRLQE